MRAGFAIWIGNLLHAQVAELVGEYPAVRAAEAGDLPVQLGDLSKVLAHLLAQRGEHASRVNADRLRLGAVVCARQQEAIACRHARPPGYLQRATGFAARRHHLQHRTARGEIQA
jgi:hypothetical protein